MFSIKTSDASPIYDSSFQQGKDHPVSTSLDQPKNVFHIDYHEQKCIEDLPNLVKVPLDDQQGSICSPRIQESQGVKINLLELPDLTSVFSYREFSYEILPMLSESVHIKFLILSSGVQRSHPYFSKTLFEDRPYASSKDWQDEMGTGTKTASAICQMFKHTLKSLTIYSGNVLNKTGQVDISQLELYCKRLLASETAFNIICLPLDTWQDSCTEQLHAELFDLSRRSIVICPAKKTSKRCKPIGPLRIGSHDPFGFNTENCNHAEFTTPSGGFFVANARFGEEDRQLFHAGGNWEVSLGLAAAPAGMATLCHVSAGKADNQTENIRTLFEQIVFHPCHLDNFEDSPLLYRRLLQQKQPDLGNLRFLQPKILINMQKMDSTAVKIEKRHGFTLFGEISAFVRKTPGHGKEQAGTPEVMDTAETKEGEHLNTPKWDISHFADGIFVHRLQQAIASLAEKLADIEFNINVAFLDSGFDGRHEYFADMTNVDHIKKVQTDPSVDTCNHGTPVIGLFWSFFANTCLKNKLKIINNKITDDPNNVSTEIFNSALDDLLERNDIHIVNISCGYPGYPGRSSEIGEKVKRLSEKTTLICAASNDGNYDPKRMAFPASDAIAVGSCKDDGSVSSFCPEGRLLFILAKGEQLAGPYSTTAPYGQTGPRPVYFSGYKGTSFAAPIASGIAALIMMKAHQPTFYLTEAEENFLRSTRIMRRLLRKACLRERHSPEKGYGPIQPYELLEIDDVFRVEIGRALQRDPYGPFGVDY